jgi:hypothetical protein
MPTERREICFAYGEIIEAIADYCAQVERPLPSGPNKHLTFSNHPEFKVTLTSNSGAPLISLQESEVAVALIFFCIKKRIPIPQRAVKSLEAVDNTVLLRMVIRG